ncbi:MAG: DUF3081 family protein [Gammaproteobacteria bacterium]|nr:DUF3081 family protein [Gammaproteobacteria bacterium]
MQLSEHLYLFNHIVSNGKKVDDKYSLNELTAWHDLDGYSCFMGYKDVTLSLYFHGRFSFDYEDSKSLLEFKELSQTLYRQIKKNDN